MRRFAFLAVACAAATASAQSVPGTVALTARLTESGAPLEGTHHVVFTLWDDAQSGATLWSETRSAELVNGGFLYVALGAVTPFGASTFDGQARFLEITLDGAVMSPRLAITSVPYALHAGDSSHLGGFAAEAFQQRVSGACSPGQYIVGVNADGTVTCDTTQATPVTTAAGSGLTQDEGALALVSCDEGDILRFGVAGWTCSTDADSWSTLPPCPGGGLLVYGEDGWECGEDGDTLATLDCSPEQVVKRVGGVWTCADDADTQYLAGEGLQLSAGTLQTAFTVAGGDYGTATTVARGDHAHDALYQRLYTSTIIVSGGGTPAENGDALRVVIDSLTDSSHDRPYLIKLEPGRYDMGGDPYYGRTYVDLEGSGREVTTVFGNSSNSVVNLAAHSEARELSIEHVGGASFSSAFWVANGGPTALRRARVSSQDGVDYTAAVRLGGNSDLTLEDVDVVAEDDGNVYAIYGVGDLQTRRSRISGGCAGGTGCAVYGMLLSKTDLQVTVEDVTIDMSSAGALVGLSLSSAPLRGNVEIRRLTAELDAVSNLQAISLGGSGGSLRVTGSQLTVIGQGTGTTQGISLWNSDARIFASQIAALGGVSPIGAMFSVPSGNSRTVRLDNSSVRSDGPTVFASNGDTPMSLRIAASQLVGLGVLTSGGPNVKCVFTYDGDDEPFGPDCTN